MDLQLYRSCALLHPFINVEANISYLFESRSLSDLLRVVQQLHATPMG